MLILGVSTQHDSGACIVRDGVVLAAANEERFSRRKFHTGWPELSINEIFDISGVKPEDIEKVALSSYVEVDETTWDWPDDPSLGERLSEWPREAVTLLSRIGIADPSFGNTGFSTFAARILGRFNKAGRMKRVQDALAELGVTAECEIIDHHLGHAYGAWLTSPWEESLVLTLDAQGDGRSSIACAAGAEGMRTFNEISFLHTPAHQYAYATRVLGYKCGREGKTTGLAACGDPSKTLPIFSDRLSYSSKLRRFVDSGYYVQPEIEYLREKLRGYAPEDIAAGVQQNLEDVCLPWVRDMVKDSGLAAPVNLCLSGGVFANVKLNQRIVDLEEINDIFVHPGMGDGGLHVGSALAVEYEATKMKPTNIPHVFWGPSYSEEEIKTAVKEFEGMNIEKPENLAKAIAEHIHNDKVIGLFSGAMEYGPRALGARSVIYHCLDRSVNDWLNKRMSRTEFMPFAPVVREEDMSRYFVGEKGGIAAQFMTVTYDVTDACKKEAPAVVHVDGTARPQSVRQDQNALYYDTITEYGKITDSPILINTSFNMHEEPIVAVPYDALRAFDIGAVDVLVLDPFIITKK